MINKLVFSSIMVSSILLSGYAAAATAIGTASYNGVSPLTITETTQLNMGDVDITKVGICAALPREGDMSFGNNCLPDPGRTMARFSFAGPDGVLQLITRAPDQQYPGYFISLLDATTQIPIIDGVGTWEIGAQVDITDPSLVEEGVHIFEYTMGFIYN